MKRLAELFITVCFLGFLLLGMLSTVLRRTAL